MDLLPKRNGKVVQWYRYTPFSANTTPSTEGAIAAGTAPTTTTVSATVAEYSNYVSLSALLLDTAIDDIAVNTAEELGYQAALSVDTLIRTEANSSTTPDLSTIGSAASVQDVRGAVARLRAADVKPKMADHFYGVFHPYALFDIQADNTAGGFIDVMKYADAGRLLSGGAMITGEEGRVAGCRITTTTNVKTSGAAPNVLYWNGIFGKGGLGAVDLEGSGPSKIQGDFNNQFKVNVIQGGPQIADPEGVIGSAVSYRYVFVTKILDSTNFRYRFFKADASLV
jgi:N4-gp56 family major capsid protein